MDEIQNYQTKVIYRLAQDKFRIRQNLYSYVGHFITVADKTNFQIDHLGYVHAVVALTQMDKVDLGSLKEYSSFVYRFTNRGVGWLPPCIFLYSTNSFAVVVANSIDRKLGKYIKETDPPKHFAAAEIPVVVSLLSQSIYHYETNPSWGSLYHDQLRGFIKKVLSVK